MRNKYPGICYRCGEHCPAGQGHFERAGKSWRVQHAHCAIKYRGTDHQHQPECEEDPLDRYHPFSGVSLGQD